MSGYDDWKTDPPAMPSGCGVADHPSRFRCVECRRTFDATAAIQHFDMTDHVIVNSAGVIQEFSFTPKCRQHVSRPEDLVQGR